VQLEQKRQDYYELRCEFEDRIGTLRNEMEKMEQQMMQGRRQMDSAQSKAREFQDGTR